MFDMVFHVIEVTNANELK